MNSRYVTNRSEYIAGNRPTSPLPSVAGQKIYRCEDEPIHIPGAIQRFGALLAMKRIAGLFSVRIVSENSHSVVGIHPESFFDLRCFTDLLVSHDKTEFLLRSNAIAATTSTLSRDYPDVFQISLTSLRGAPIPLYCAMHQNVESDLIICEFELEQDLFNPIGPLDSLPDEPVQIIQHQATEAERLLSTTSKSRPIHALEMVRQKSRPPSGLDMFQILSEIQLQLGGNTELQTLLDQIVGLVYDITGFHRVMIYQFDETAAGMYLCHIYSILFLGKVN
jgi:light-regulated signal transduction histidine kinase (bacteriophytochrome)